MSDASTVEARGHSGFFEGLIARPIALLVIFVTLLVIGVISYRSIPIQMMPAGMVQPGLMVWVSHPGASAQENEEKVTRPLEEQLRTLSGVVEIQSTSREDRATIFIEFEANSDMDFSKAEVRDRMERARGQLPDTVEDVGIFSFDESQMPILFLAILHPGDSDRTDFLVESVIQRRLEAVDGAGLIEIWGILDDAVRILLNEDRVAAANLDLGSLIRRLSSDNFAMPMGVVEDGGTRMIMRSDMRFRSLDEIRSYPVGDGLTIGDLAEVVESKSVRNRLYRIDGSYSYYAEIQKDSQANVVATCSRMIEAIEELERDPRLSEFEFIVIFNQAELIQSSLDQLRDTAVWGGGLAVVVLLSFLRRLRLTLCVALSIPVSAMLAIAWSYFSGGTFNVLTMTGITLAIGMLVDNSVVVIENITRLRALGCSTREAAWRGTAEVGLAVTLATLTSVVVFLPLIFMTDNRVMRIIFGELGFPLCISLLASLLVALVFLPVAAARIVNERSARFNGLLQRLEPLWVIPGRLVKLLLALLHALWFLLLRGLFHINRVLLALLAPLRYVLAAAVIAFTVFKIRGASTALMSAKGLELLNAKPPGATPSLLTAYGMLGALAVGLTIFGLKLFRNRPARPPKAPDHFGPRNPSLLALAVAANGGLLNWTLRRRMLGCALGFLLLLSVIIPKSNMTIAAFGEDEETTQINIFVNLESNFTLAEASDEMAVYERFLEGKREQYGFQHLGVRFDEREGRMTLYWEESQELERLEEIRSELQLQMPKRPGHEVLMRGEDEGAVRNKNLVFFNLRGPDSEELRALGTKAVAILSEIPGLSSLSTARQSSPDQVQVVFDPALSERLGVTPEVALRNIGWALRGWQLPRYQEPGREVPLYLEYDEEQLAGLDTLRDLQIYTGESVVPLATVAQLEFTKGTHAIYRSNGQATFTITGRVGDPSKQRRISMLGANLLKEKLELPRGYSLGEEDLAFFRQEEELKELKTAFFFSLALVFLIIGILFESFILPFTVLVTIPFAIVGAFWTLYLTGTELDSVGWIGLIILIGVVVNNGIVLIDRIHRLRREEGRNRLDAVIEGSAQRVRPIMITAITTVIGLLPMAIAAPPSEGIDYRALATCVAGGLATSTIFTLWAVPLLYTILDDFAQLAGRGASWALAPLAGRRRASRPVAP